TSIADNLLIIFDKYQRKKDPINYQTELFQKQLLGYINKEQPIKMFLPAFHSKSINSRSVLSQLPDYAEYIAVKNLKNLCKEIEAVYPGGCELMLFHEAYLFVDIGIVPSDDVIDQYLQKLYSYIEHKSIQGSSLKTIYPQLNCNKKMRFRFMEDYAPSMN